MNVINAKLSGHKIRIREAPVGDGTNNRIVDNLENGRECQFEMDDVESFIGALIMVEAI
jgi:hypothetical protein